MSTNTLVWKPELSIELEEAERADERRKESERLFFLFLKTLHLGARIYNCAIWLETSFISLCIMPERVCVFRNDPLEEYFPSIPWEGIEASDLPQDFFNAVQVEEIKMTIDEDPNSIRDFIQKRSSRRKNKNRVSLSEIGDNEEIAEAYCRDEENFL